MERYPGFIDRHGDMIELELESHARVDFLMTVALHHLGMRLAASGLSVETSDLQWLIPLHSDSGLASFC